MLRRKYESSLSNFFLHIKHTSKKSFIIIRVDLCNLWAVNNLLFYMFYVFYLYRNILEIREICGTLLSIRGTRILIRERLIFIFHIIH